MPIYVELPIERTTSKLADWIEINALIDPDKSVSIQDLLYSLRSEQDDPEDQIGESEADSTVSDVFSEIQRREKSAGDAYPFYLKGDKIKRKKGVTGFLSYKFCLLISFFGTDKHQYCEKWKKDNVAKKFEELSAVAVQSLLHNKNLYAKTVVFGWPRRWQGDVSNPRFLKALKKICSQCSEMKPRNRPAAEIAKDAGLDVIAWKGFPDKLPGGLLFLGQCAAGSDWGTKLGNVNRFKAFVEDHTPPITGMFIPHVPDISNTYHLDNWNITVQLLGGMLFNRCRIALLTKHWKDNWTNNLCRKALKQIKSQVSRDFLGR
jgi:hypothetical protein